MRKSSHASAAGLPVRSEIEKDELARSPLASANGLLLRFL
jgi:hypothetical protein